MKDEASRNKHLIIHSFMLLAWIAITDELILREHCFAINDEDVPQLHQWRSFCVIIISRTKNQQSRIKNAVHTPSTCQRFYSDSSKNASMKDDGSLWKKEGWSHAGSAATSILKSSLVLRVLSGPPPIPPSTPHPTPNPATLPILIPVSHFRFPAQYVFFISKAHSNERNIMFCLNLCLVGVNWN